MKVKINTHGNALPEVHGEWIDLCTAEDVALDFLEYKIIESVVEFINYEGGRGIPIDIEALRAAAERM